MRRSSTALQRALGDCAVKNPYIDANQHRAKNPDMMVFQITGGMLRAARSLTGMTQQQGAAGRRKNRPLGMCPARRDSVFVVSAAWVGFSQRSRHRHYRMAPELAAVRARRRGLETRGASSF
jgi:hypothetical protein